MAANTDQAGTADTNDTIENGEVVIEGTVFTERQVKLLKYVVIGLGVLMVVGLAVIIGTVIYRASNMGSDKADGGQVISQTISGANANLSNIEIIKGSKVISTSLNGSRLAVTTENKGSYSILVIDARTGKLLSRTTLAPKP